MPPAPWRGEALAMSALAPVPGLHHVTAICGWPQTNVDFWTGHMAERLIKRTVNFDDPGTWHLYYGDAAGRPGSVMTYFPFVDAGPGRAGPGMAVGVAYRAAPAAFEAMIDRLAGDGQDFGGPEERFGARTLSFSDPDGLRVEVVEDEAAAGDVPDAFHSVTLWLDDPEPTARLLTELFGWHEAGEADDEAGRRLRLVSPEKEPGAAVDLLRSDRPSIGRQGAGTIHHVAFRARDGEEQLARREQLASAGFDVTPVIDRQYFDAIYFRSPGGVLFEVATDPPGFAIDEPADALGRELKLPERYEAMRARIEATLPPIEAPQG